ncbi:MAG: peptide deformylase, partial [Psittacicella sp.]
MAILDVLIYPEDGLKMKAKPVEVIDDSIKTIVSDMFDTMRKENGIGLAATQVNLDKRIVVIDIEEDKRTPLTLINPVILEARGSAEMEEGCLSLPGIHEIVKRKAEVKIEYTNLNNEKITLDADGLLAICIQHEIDHLNGVMFIDYFSGLKKQLIRIG